MAATLPDGTRVFLGTGFSAEKTVSAITNAKPAKATSTAHGLNDGEYFTLKSGWQDLNERVFRVAAKDVNTFDVQGSDTVDVSRYPVGQGAGSLVAVTGWTQITQVLSFEMSGGDQQFSTFSFLEEDFERELPTVTSARSISIGIADDPTGLGQIALQALEGKKVTRPLRLELPNGSVLVYNGVVSFNSTPSLSKGEVMQVTASFSLAGRPTRL